MIDISRIITHTQSLTPFSNRPFNICYYNNTATCLNQSITHSLLKRDTGPARPFIEMSLDCEKSINSQY